MVRVLKARNVIDPDAQPADTMPEQDSERSVEQLLPLLASHKDGIRIMRDGAVMGVVTAGSVISALAHQDTHRGAEVPA